MSALPRFRSLTRSIAQLAPLRVSVVLAAHLSPSVVSSRSLSSSLAPLRASSLPLALPERFASAVAMAAAAAGAGLKKGAYPNLLSDADKCHRFIAEFIEDYATGEKKYMAQLQRIADRQQATLNISVDDLRQVSSAHRRPNSTAEKKRRMSKQANEVSGRMSDRQVLTLCFACCPFWPALLAFSSLSSSAMKSSVIRC